MLDILKKNSIWFMYDKNHYKIVEIKITDKDIKIDNILFKYHFDGKGISLASNVAGVSAYLTKINSRQLEYQEFNDGSLEYVVRLIS